MNTVTDGRAGRVDATVVTAPGDVDLYTAPSLRQILRGEISQGGGAPFVIVDMRLAAFVDADGVGVLMEAGKAARRLGGRLALAGMSDRLLTKLEQVKLTGTGLFMLVATVEEGERELTAVRGGGAS